MLGVAVIVLLAVSGAGEAATTVTIGPGTVVLPLGARQQIGFQFGPVDGVMGGVKKSPGHYRFFGAAQSLNTAACPGTPGVQGVYAFTSDLSVSPPTFTSDCVALLHPSGPPVKTGIDGAFDRNYVGGGPTMRVRHPDGRPGILLVYHAEVQWYDDGPCADPGNVLCFYGTLGMAISTDDGATFQKLGLIVQSHISRATFHTPPFLGGNVPIGNGKGYFVEPTIFDGVTNSMKIAREEIFGPVLSVIPFRSVEDGIAQGNATAYGLAAAVWTRDVSKALKAARAIRAGTVWVNAYNLFDAALPFGGFKESGFGREMGSVGLDSYTEVKTVWVDLS
jgi:hypothetical protein